MYNYDVLGTRHNKGEKALTKDNVATLEEKWRFPRKGSLFQLVGVIHATPVVVNGYVYFGTATFPTFYKLTPDGKVKWVYHPDPPKGPAPAFGLPTAGFMNAALVTSDTVYRFDGSTDAAAYESNPAGTAINRSYMSAGDGLSVT